jgi:hypothetical protein
MRNPVITTTLVSIVGNLPNLANYFFTTLSETPEAGAQAFALPLPFRSITVIGRCQREIPKIRMIALASASCRRAHARA